MTPLYVRENMVSWSTLALDNLEATIEFEVSSIGYLEVYDSLEKLQEDYGKDEEYFLIECEDEDYKQLRGSSH